MDLESITLRQLRYLDAVATGTSYSDAADDLGVSQSALSQGLARLEQLAGAPLFEQDGRRRRLNHHGAVLAEYAERVLADTARMGAQLRARAEGATGNLRLAMIDAAALYLFATPIHRFATSHPNVSMTIHVETSDGCLDMLRRFEVDLAIVAAPAGDAATRHLVDEPFYLYGPSTGPPPADARWMLYPSGSHTRALIDSTLRELGIVADVAGESGNPAVLRQLALLMGGWTVLPDQVGTVDTPGWVRGPHLMTRPIVAAFRRSAADPVVARLLNALTTT